MDKYYFATIHHNLHTYKMYTMFFNNNEDPKLNNNMSLLHFTLLHLWEAALYSASSEHHSIPTHEHGGVSIKFSSITNYDVIGVESRH